MTGVAPSAIPLAELVDTGSFPLHDPGSLRYLEVVDNAQAQLEATGCALLKDFILPDALPRLAAEVAANNAKAHVPAQPMNPYLHTESDPERPDDHPVNTFLERTGGTIPGDAWIADGPTDSLYRAPELTRFLAHCLQRPVLHRYADPLAGLTATVLDPGQQLAWHFDPNDVAVTLLIQQADDGGRFEYSPDIRSADDEGFDEVAQVLAGDRQRVVSLDLQPGDLQIFRGRHSLHRVTPVHDDAGPRHAVVMAYTDDPDVIGPPDRTRRLFGRVLPAHEAAEGHQGGADKGQN
ncbi:MAG: hypothetical protein AAFN30_16305 [Actinomycetota bacterium]